jgi:hypothetical protein
MNHSSRRFVVWTLSTDTGRFWWRNVPPARRGELRILCFCACCVKNAYQYKIHIKIVDFWWCSYNVKSHQILSVSIRLDVSSSQQFFILALYSVVLQELYCTSFGVHKRQKCWHRSLYAQTSFQYRKGSEDSVNPERFYFSAGKY